MTGWNIKNLHKLLEVAKSDWKRVNSNHQLLGLLYIEKELDKEIKWFEERLTELLNKHVKSIQITFYFKR